MKTRSGQSRSLAFLNVSLIRGVAASFIAGKKNKSCIISPQVATERSLDSFLELFNHLSVLFLLVSLFPILSLSSILLSPTVLVSSRELLFVFFYFCGAGILGKKKKRKKP